METSAGWHTVSIKTSSFGTMKTRSITAAVRPALSQTPAWVLDLATIRRLEGRWLDETEPGELMACAGAAVARVAMAMWKNLPAHAPVILLVGPGNNGGDALVAGRILRRAGLAVWAAGMPGLDTMPPEAEDARAAWEAWRADGQVIHGFEQVADWLWPDGNVPAGDDGDVPPAEPALIIDGLFGIGLTRPLAGRVAGLVRMVNRARVPVLAIDVPSGLDADRGAPVGGSDAPVMQARQTVTMIADKPGLHTGAGLRHAGRVWVAPLSDLPLEAELDALEAADGPADAGEWRDVPTEAEAETDPDDGHDFGGSGMDDADADAPCPADDGSFPHDLPGVLLTAPLAAALLPARARDAHKGNGGDVLVVGGRLGMAGAARLAAQGAAGAGAGVDCRRARDLLSDRGDGGVRIAAAGRRCRGCAGAGAGSRCGRLVHGRINRSAGGRGRRRGGRPAGRIRQGTAAGRPASPGNHALCVGEPCRLAGGCARPGGGLRSGAG